MATNEALRDHVTSIGFSLTLSKNMIDTLVVLDHFKGNFSEVVTWNAANGKTRPAQSSHYRFNHYVSTFKSLESRGLVRAVHKYGKDGYRDIERSRHQVTRAGKLVISLLKEAGLYQDRHTDLGLDKPVVVAA